jgi:hypothetical protein
MYWTGRFSCHFKVYVKLPTFPPYHNCNIYLELKWQMVGSPIYDGHIRVIYVDYLLLSCMPVYMLLYVCYMHMIPSFHKTFYYIKWSFCQHSRCSVWWARLKHKFEMKMSFIMKWRNHMHIITYNNIYTGIHDNSK